VRVVISPDGHTVWVTTRGSNALLGFSASRLMHDPAHALQADVRVGQAPVGLAIVDHGRRIVVADSNRFLVPGSTAGLTVIDTAAALAGKPAVLGFIEAGKFPREESLEPNGTLLITNFASDQLEAVNTTNLP
jgi:DNA-binding beta-propeller fold protein YncE